MTLPIIAELRFHCGLDPHRRLVRGGNFCVFDKVVRGEVDHGDNSYPLALEVQRERRERCGYEAENNNIGRSASSTNSTCYLLVLSAYPVVPGT